MSNIESYLFSTNAIRFFSENKPFWYTSGKIGPYFINTHFVYGNEKDAVELLSFIDDELSSPSTLPKRVFEKTLTQYNENEIYRNVIDSMITTIKNTVDVDTIDYVSGGERRDWFFSNLIANILGKPHISIFKDLSTIINSSDFTTSIDIKDLKSANVLHIADLITVASSYVRAWIPAIEDLNAKITHSCVVVDRMQGGTKIIEDKGIKSISLVSVDTTLFQKAFEMGLITKNSQELLNNFYINPDETMKNFLIEHPEFIKESLEADEKTKKRAQLLVDNNLYGLN